MQYFIITPLTANVTSLKEMAEIGFGVRRLVLIQANGMLYEDSEATRGKK